MSRVEWGSPEGDGGWGNGEMLEGQVSVVQVGKVLGPNVQLGDHSSLLRR